MKQVVVLIIGMLVGAAIPVGAQQWNSIEAMYGMVFAAETIRYLGQVHGSDYAIKFADAVSSCRDNRAIERAARIYEDKTRSTTKRADGAITQLAVCGGWTP